METNLVIYCVECDTSLNVQVKKEDNEFLLYVRPCPACLSEKWDDGYDHGYSDAE